MPPQGTFHFILVSMYQFWCSWEILLTVAVIHELKLKLEGGDEPSSFEALLTEFTLHPAP